MEKLEGWAGNGLLHSINMAKFHSAVREMLQTPLCRSSNQELNQQ
ncbi:hypothetical protein DUNSADRAFT_18373 [Dunaliella salina]|uniref:Uncharacterized protein n=1 Tax=Dunaliella salina TaxID=3046 RepID=A0ABQ7G065_DUNSA|nr:hypothetical protein DUNSADRAFT_18373 [Dunaliella salina]|eukprot:KAF5827999.1 hypothetical protein DUNSADRAFT_18373 [Dunaliella salina]